MSRRASRSSGPEPVERDGLARRLLAAMESPGCPLCQVGREQEQRFFFWFFAENHHTPETLGRMVASHGFCAQHAQGLAAEGDAHAAALTSVYEFLARKVGTELTAAAKRAEATWPGRTIGPCPACSSREGAERRLLEPLAALLADERERARYRPPHLLCATHLRWLEPHLDQASLRWALQRHRAALETTTQDPDGPAGGAIAREVGSVLDRPPSASGADRADVRSIVGRTLDDAGQCPVCAAQAEAYRAWLHYCRAHAGGSEAIEDLLPSCDEHVAAFAVQGTDRLRDRTLENRRHLLHDIVGRAATALEERPAVSWRERLRRFATEGGSEPAERRARRTLQRMPACPVCTMLEATRERALELCALLVQTGPGRTRYERGHGLCLRHLRAGLAAATDHGSRKALLDHARLDVGLLAWELQEAVRLDAWTARPLADGADEESWRRALYRFAGAPPTGLRRAADAQQELRRQAEARELTSAHRENSP